MTGGIHVLPPEVAARIAAGEVVERPASVVRELLDNAVDAGASRVTVEIEDGGIAMIRVVDDGRGIPPGDVELAFERHATSKIASLEDLTGIGTLGFRGEALPSVAAAADVDVVTRVAEEPTGVHLVLANGEVVRRHGRAAPIGTSIAVMDLFGRLPARRKFLGSPAGEARAIATLVAHYALAYPGVAFRFVSGGRVAMQTPGDGDARHAFAAVYGADAAARMLPVQLAGEHATVTGLAGPPDVTRGNRSGVSVFVNGRWVQSRALVFAAIDAYQSLLPGGRFPLVALSVSLPGEDVDVNVHPAKAEVRFRDERLVARAVRQAVGAALSAAPAASWTAAPPAPVPARGLSLRERLMPPALRTTAPVQASLGLGRTGPGVTSQRETLPLLRPVGQVGATYIVCEGPDGVYLVDQHAAHERVLYDRLVLNPQQAAGRQPLLEPALVEFDVPAAAVANEYLDELERLGLALEPFGEHAFLLRAVPVGMATVDPAGAARALVEDLGSGRQTGSPAERAAATVACHASVRAGMALALEEMRRLLEELEATPRPRTCPHGRPTLIHLSREAIERQFGRR